MIDQLAGFFRDSDWRLNSTPETYSQVRTMNGSSWLTSSKPAPQRARMSPAPTLNTLCRTRTGMISSQYGVERLARR